VASVDAGCRPRPRRVRGVTVRSVVSAPADRCLVRQFGGDDGRDRMQICCAELERMPQGRGLRGSRLGDPPVVLVYVPHGDGPSAIDASA
jgi:hypothetical protein